MSGRMRVDGGGARTTATSTGPEIGTAVQIGSDGSKKAGWPNGASAELKDGKLAINGTANADNIRVGRAKNGDITVTVDGVTERFKNVDAIQVNGGRGADKITVGAGVRDHVRVNGGGGNDVVNANGRDMFVSGGRGNDQVNAGNQNVVARGGRGNDTLAWVGMAPKDAKGFEQEIGTSPAIYGGED